MQIVPFLNSIWNNTEKWVWCMEFYVNKDTAWLRRIVRWAVNVVVVLALAWFLVYAFCAQVPVSGNSMQPVLSADDVVLVNRLVYDVGGPERFDIVVFEREDHKKNVKRVIGLPGETVQIKGGFVFINGEVLGVDNGLEQVSLAGRADTPIQLEEDEYFLLGDNRDSSEDSRFSNIGNVKREQIYGKVWFRILPLLKLDFIHSK